MNNIVYKAKMSNFINSIDKAIRDVGGNTSGVDNICDYPTIINDQLTSGYDIISGQGTTIEKDGTIFKINANSNAVLLEDVVFEGVTIPKGTTIQQAFNILFTDILPNLPTISNDEIDEMFK